MTPFVIFGKAIKKVILTLCLFYIFCRTHVHVIFKNNKNQLIIMTKRNLCGKIVGMNTLTNRKIKYLALILLSLIAICSAFGFLRSYSVKASTPKNTELFLPKTGLEYYELSSPIDVYSDDEITAIAYDQDKLILNLDGDFFPTITLETLKQVDKFTSDRLIVLSRAILRTVNLSSPNTIQDLSYNSSSISANYFALNDSYLITAFGGEIYIYNLDNGIVTSMLPVTIKEANSDTPVAINDNNDIFYANNSGKLISTNISSLGTVKEYLDVVPSRIIAKGDFVYYLTNGGRIYKLNVNDKTNVELTIPTGTRYDLGYVISPTSISFKGDNLLVTDSNKNTVQEFKIDGNNLVFTGFAVAENKTAFNRIGKTAKDVEVYGDTLAILDGYKFTLINANDNFDAYNPDCFTDYTASELGGALPDRFALGKNTALFLYSPSTTNSFVKLFNLKDGILSEQFSVPTYSAIRDITYQSGYYYLVSDDAGTDTKVYKFDENGVVFDTVVLNKNLSERAKKLIVDVFGNIFILNEQDKITKYQSGNDIFTVPAPSGVSLLDLSTDLGGTIFALGNNNTVYYLDAQRTWQSEQLQSPVRNALASSFAMNFVNKQVYFIFNGQEFVYKTTELSNLALTSLPVPTEYKTTASNADVDALKLIKPKDGANVYSVTLTEQNGFKFNELIDSGKEYALISTIVPTSYVDTTLKLYALAGQDGVVIINENQADYLPVDFSESPDKAFVTTSVSMYYLPIITKNGGYALSNENGVIELAKGTEILPFTNTAFTFLDREYYFAKATVNGVEYTGYVPIAFTVPVLAEDVTFEEYSYVKVKKTSMYREKDFTTYLTDLPNNTVVKLIETDKTIAKIAYKTNGGWSVAYVSAQAIKNEPNVAIRNTLIILAVSACVCGTGTYFLLRSKEKFE